MNARLIIAFGLLMSGLASAEDKKPLASFIELPWRYVIGGYENSRWLKSDATGRKLASKKTEYRLFTLKGEAGTVSGSSAAPDTEVCPDIWLQKITPEPELTQAAIGVHASWNPQPRKAKVMDPSQDAYQRAVADLLAGKGVAKPQIKIAQLLRVDLDGDGEDEVLISATRYVHKDELMTAEAGDYSFVALRRVVKGAVRTQILSGEFYPKKMEDAAPNIHEISGLLDLNGDGVLEVLINSTYYEGGGLKVWQLQKDKLVTVLEIECGV